MDIKELLVVFLYNQIRGFAQRVLGAVGLPIDYILLAIGWWKKDTWWGRGLIYGAVASIGSTMGLQIFAGLGLQGAPTAQGQQLPQQVIY